jgi:hypothetical protein
MIGNLKMYLGAEDINHYAEFLNRLLYPLAPEKVVLWLMRAGLIGALLLHLHAAYSLTQMNRHARAVRYQSARDYQIANFASRSMRLTGIVVLLFIVWHLLDLTFGSVNTIGANGDFVKTCTPTSCAASNEIPVAVFYILRQPRPRRAPLPRGVEHLPEPRVQQPTLQSVAADVRHRPRGRRRHRQRLVPRRRARRRRRLILEETPS